MAIFCDVAVCGGVSENGTISRILSRWMVEWNVWPLGELDGLFAVFVEGVVLWRGPMEYSKSQELSNPLSLGPESKDSRS